MLAELVGHVIGIDPDRDWITGDELKARPTARSPAASSATSPAKSGGSSSTPTHPKSPLDEHRRIVTNGPL